MASVARPSDRELIVLLCDDDEDESVQVVIFGPSPTAGDAGGRLGGTELPG